ncbi:response regulator [Haliangium sp.]|uniref:response regulator n=1 Tax=Haliangium sp. TaxID=2663208 RepID=UPI003D0CA030
MRILVVDNGEHMALDIAEVLRDLGQEAIVSPDPAHAVEMARQLPIDGVIADLSMPSMNAVELAEALWLFECYVPLAFRRSSERSELIVHAAEFGILFPNDWSVADIEQIVGHVEHTRPRRLARGSQVSLPPVASPECPSPECPSPQRPSPEYPSPECPSLQHPSPEYPSPQHPSPSPSGPTSQIWTVVPLRKVARRLAVSCRTWEQVLRLCSRSEAGDHYLLLRGPYRLSVGACLMVSLELPGGLVLSLMAEVSAIVGSGAEQVTVIDVQALTDSLRNGLRTLAHRPHSRPTQ